MWEDTKTRTRVVKRREEELTAEEFSLLSSYKSLKLELQARTGPKGKAAEAVQPEAVLEKRPAPEDAIDRAKRVWAAAGGADQKCAGSAVGKVRRKSSAQKKPVIRLLRKETQQLRRDEAGKGPSARRGDNFDDILDSL